MTEKLTTLTDLRISVGRDVYVPSFMCVGRYAMWSKSGDYVEATDRLTLTGIRAANRMFKYARIYRVLQAWADVVLPEVIYPPIVKTSYDFMLFNQQINEEERP